MTTKYFALLTNQGAAKLANAAALGTKVQITQMGVGDGGGALPTPTGTQTVLIGEKRRAVLNALSVDAANSSQIIAEQIIPENEGGFWIREIGLYDSENTLIAVANCPETYKPLLAEGSGRTQTVRMILIINSTDAVTLKIDPSVVLATRQYVDTKVIEVKAYADELMAQHLAEVAARLAYVPGVVGASRKAKMNVIAASKTATFIADELIVESSAGEQYRLSAFSKTVNLAAAGAGGMDTGAVPSAGFVGLYAIFNPTTKTADVLAVNASSSQLDERYTGANMPAGYTASALISVWPVSGAMFAIGCQEGRFIAPLSTGMLSAASTATAAAVTTFATLSFPKNAKTISGYGTVTVGAAQSADLWLCALPVVNSGRRFAINALSNNGLGMTFPFDRHPVYTAQTLYYSAFSSNGASFVFGINMTGYTF
ncbi:MULTISPECIES: phage tail protein [Rahnella]|uniref:Phage tail protein n=1 Tax=Rahnella laticis TaxID=2787622 RepID=A0ABS0E6N0_9GAMM|nr:MULTISPECIES: phage tail protein [Rahnella]MBF7980496.1 phage tail protein [Rahnella laticis]MBF8000244.1 phage tail protein [Rahnella sp. LAC-M12]